MKEEGDMTDNNDSPTLSPQARSILAGADPPKFKSDPDRLLPRQRREVPLDGPRLEDLTGEEAFDTLMGDVQEALIAKARGGPIDEATELAAYEAATILAASELIRSGMTPERVAATFLERDYEVRLRYDGEAFDITLEWLDGQPPPSSESP